MLEQCGGDGVDDIVAMPTIDPSPIPHPRSQLLGDCSVHSSTLCTLPLPDPRPRSLLTSFALTSNPIVSPSVPLLLHGPITTWVCWEHPANETDQV